MAATRGRAAHQPQKRISLALQGGGAHGAFTWGVLDALLEDRRIAIAGVSGASAGAVNAVMLADGLARGGPDEARRRLAEFWRAASLGGSLPGAQRAAVDRLLALMPAPPAMQNLVRGMSRFLSPAELNPLNLNPLRDLIDRQVDFDAIRRFGALELLIAATNVHTGEARIFTRREVSADVVMASAALPLLFQAVEIEGVPYWDGGYAANPPILPLARATGDADVLLVQINPSQRHGTPSSSQGIVDRINEITFNTSLAAELRTLALIDRLIDEGRLAPDEDYRRIHLHRILLDADQRLPASSRLDIGYKFLDKLHTAGRRAARRFLDAHFDDIGSRGTMPLQRAA